MNFYVLCIYDIGTMDECLFCRKLHRVIKFKAQFLYWISKALKVVLPIKTKVFLTTLPSAEIFMFNKSYSWTLKNCQAGGIVGLL